MTQDHDALRDHTGLYALGALTEEERERFDQHVRVCPQCAAEVRSLGGVIAALPFAVAQVDPPAGLRERIIGGVAGRTPAATRTVDGGGHAARVTRLPLVWPAWLAAAAAIVAAVGLGFYVLQLRERLALVEAQLRQAQDRANEAEVQVARASGIAAEARQTLAILSAPDLARIDLAGQPPARVARARAFWSRSRGLVFTASNLPPLPPGRTYQLWVVTADAPVSAGLLTPDPSGSVSVVIDTSPDLATPVAMAVTLEPAGGVPAPTGEKYLVGTPSL